MQILKKALLGSVLLGATLLAQAGPSLKVAVTDLAYEERQEYFVRSGDGKPLRASARESERTASIPIPCASVRSMPVRSRPTL